MASLKMMNINTWKGNSKLEEASTLRKEIMTNYEIFLTDAFNQFMTSMFNDRENPLTILPSNPEFRNLTILDDVVGDYHTLNKISLAKHISVREEGIIESHILGYEGKFLIMESLANKKGVKLRYQLIPCLDTDVLVIDPINIENLKLFAEAMLKSSKDYAIEEINNTLERLKMSGLSTDEILSTLQMAYTNFQLREAPENKGLEDKGVKLS